MSLSWINMSFKVTQKGTQIMRFLIKTNKESWNAQIEIKASRRTWVQDSGYHYVPPLSLSHSSNALLCACTRWHITLIQTSRWHQNKSAVFACPALPGQYGTFVLMSTGGLNQRDVSPCVYFSKMELWLCSQRKIGLKVMRHPVFRKDNRCEQEKVSCWVTDRPRREIFPPNFHLIKRASSIAISESSTLCYRPFLDRNCWVLRFGHVQTLKSFT